MEASKDYRDNMYGASYVSQFLKKKKKKEEKEEGMSCSEHGCAAYNSGGGGSDAGTVSYKEGGSGNSGSKGAANVVLTKKQADKRAEEFEKNRKKAPAMKTMTKNQQKAQSAMGPPAPKK